MARRFFSIAATLVLVAGCAAPVVTPPVAAQATPTPVQATPAPTDTPTVTPEPTVTPAPTDTPEPTEAPTPAPKTGVIAKLSGKADKNGKPFHYDGTGSLTLSYTVTGGDFGGTYDSVAFYVWAKGDPGNAGFAITDQDGRGKGSTELVADSGDNAMGEGDYYIMVLDANASWTVTITETQ